MTEMFFPAMLFFAILCIPLAFLPHYDFCADRCRAFFQRLLHRNDGAHDPRHKHA